MVLSFLQRKYIPHITTEKDFKNGAAETVVKKKNFLREVFQETLVHFCLRLSWDIKKGSLMGMDQNFSRNIFNHVANVKAERIPR